MSNWNIEHVLEIKKWNDHLTSFRTTRKSGFRFENGQFTMLGLIVEDKLIARAYSMASASHEEYLEFLMATIPGGKLTPSIASLKEGDSILVSNKATGTLLLSDLNPGKRLWLFSTGTGIAPFVSILRDCDVFLMFEQVILVHSVRVINDLVYRYYFEHDIYAHGLIGPVPKRKFIYYPTVTREDFKHTGRITDALQSKKLFKDLKLSELDPSTDRLMICGNPEMNKELGEYFDTLGFKISPYIGAKGDYLVEKAFVSK